MQSFSSDIIIVGGGMAGMALALALAKETHLSITILEAEASSPIWSEGPYHHRVSAITLASQRIFHALQLWESIQTKRISPFQAIHVWDAQTLAEIYFGSEEIAEPLLGFIIENQVMQIAMEERRQTFPSIKKNCTGAINFIPRNKPWC